MELPQTTGKFRNLIFAVIGGPDAGKSHYLAVLIQQLLKEVGRKFDMLLEPLGDETITRYRKEFYKPLYERQTVINKTTSGVDQDAAVRIPLVYTLTFRGKTLRGHSRIRAAVTLVFFDTAGEDMNNTDKMEIVNKYICESDGLILLLDPLQFAEVRRRLAGTAHLPEEANDASELVSRLSNLLQGAQGTKMIPKPLAVAFSKFDAVMPLMDPQLQLNSQPRHDRGYDVADFEAVHAEMQTLLEDWNGRLPHQIEMRYRKFGYFGLTALGCEPGPAQKVPRVTPRRVEDPFLWLLHHHGLIRAAKNRR